jgi:Secretion system C-terminal sorting domain
MGIYVEGTDGQKVWDNYIEGFGTGSGDAFGIISNSAASVGANITYHNTLKNTDVGFSGINNNSKMQVKCNQLLDNSYDIAVTSGDFPNQGKNAFAVDPDYYTGPAGDVFNHSICNTTSPSTKNEVFCYTGLAPIKFVHHTNTDRIPYCHTSNVTLIPSGASATASGSNACLDLLNTHVPVSTITTLRGQIIVLRSYFDNGGSSHRIGIINTTAKGDVILDTFNKIEFASDELIDAAMQRTDILSDDDRFNILLNTAPHSHAILQKLMTTYELKEWMKDSIMTFVGDTSTRLGMLDTLYYMSDMYDIMTNDYLGVLQDTGGFAAIIDFLKGDSTEIGISHTIDYKIMNAQDGDAATIMAAFNPINNDLREEKIIQSIKLNLRASGKDFDSMSPSQIDTLNTLADSYSFAGIKARNILRHLNLRTFDELIELPDQGEEFRRAQPETKVHEAQIPQGFAVYPNPSNQELFLTYNISDLNGGTFRILDICGKEVSQGLLTNGYGDKKLNMKDYVNGIFFIVVESNGKLVFNDKFVVMH